MFIDNKTNTRRFMRCVSGKYKWNLASIGSLQQIKKNRKTSFISNRFCFFFFMLKLCTYEEGMHDMGVIALFFYYLYCVSKCSFAQRDSSVHHSSVWSCNWCGWCLGHRMAGSASLHEQGDIPPPHHSVAQQEPVQRIIKKEKHWIEELFMFLLASLPILGLQCNELSPFNTEPLHGNGRLPLIYI